MTKNALIKLAASMGAKVHYNGMWRATFRKKKSRTWGDGRPVVLSGHTKAELAQVLVDCQRSNERRGIAQPRRGT